MSLYREHRYFSIWHDAEMARLSLVDGAGREYWAVVPVDNGRAWRERRDAVLTTIDAAIRRGEGAGEVRL